MSDIGAAMRDTESWAPETPFLLDPVSGAGGSPRAAGESGPSFALESPFLSEHGVDGTGAVRTPQAEAFAELMEQLRDEEFEHALVRLADEASAVAGGPASEGESSAGTRERQERMAGAYLDRVAASAEAMLERMADASERTSLAGMSSEALDEYFEQFAPAGEGETLGAEQFFLKKIFKKAVAAAKGAIDLAKKGASAIGSVLPHGLILRQLKRLVRPIVGRVLRFAIDRLPVALRPMAKTLAARLFGTSEAESEETAGEAASIDAREIAAEFDTMVAGSLVGGEAFDRQIAMELQLESREGDRDAIRELDRARATLVDRLSELREGEDPRPAVEQFVPAVLAALRIGMKLLGRPKVVGFLSGHLADFIKPHVGADNARTLSNALVDAGLRLVQLEGEGEDGARLAAETVATTLEDTVTRLANELPAEAWEHETMLESYARDAFEKAASAHFPDDTIKSELHEANEVKGVWMRRPGRYYKKYSRVPSVVLTPQIARAIPSFRGAPLGVILRDRFGITGPVRVNIHLYEAVPGTTVGAIARGESESAAEGEALMDEGFVHPLTEEAAGLLLREPGLGRSVDEAFLESPNRLGVGQRLFRVQMADRSGTGARRTRSRRLRISLDLRRSEVRMRLYLSEAVAQEIARALRRKAPAAVVLNLLRRTFEPQVAAHGEAPDTVRVIGESLGEESEAVTRRVRRRLGGRLRRMVHQSLVRALAAELERRYHEFAAAFDTAANDPAEGVTVSVTLRGVPWMGLVRRTASLTARHESEEPRAGATTSSHTIAVVPGHVA
jgi:hypothetical protein